MWKLKEWIDKEDEKVRRNSIMIEGVQFTRLDGKEWSLAMKEGAGQRREGSWEIGRASCRERVF